MGNKTNTKNQKQESIGQKNLKEYEANLRKLKSTQKTYKIPIIEGSNNCSIKEVYEFLGILSLSKTATIRKAKKKKETEKLFAIKSFELSLKDDIYLEKLIHEVGTLIKISHPNLVNFVETYYDSQYFHIVMDYFEGLPLKEFLKKYKVKPEKIGKIAFQLFKVVAYLQTNGISNVKLYANNVCLDTNLKLTLTGFGSVITDDEELKIYNIKFISPEEILGKPSQKSTVWKIGVILYLIAYGQLPFFGKTVKEVKYAILKEEAYAYEDDVNWKLINLCLVKNPEERLTIEDALEMLGSGKDRDDKLTFEALERIKDYNKEPVFKKIVYEHILKNVPQDDLLELTKIFNSIDLDNQGTISKEELRSAFKNNKIDISEERLIKIMELFDNDGNDEIDYKEFLLAGLKDYVTIDNELLGEVFDTFDSENDGFISVGDLEKMMLRGGKQVVDGKALKKILLEISDTEKVSKEQFIKLFK